MSRGPRRRDDQSGAVAVVVAFLTLALFAAGAIAIDLGNAYTRARSIQNQADFAALSVGDLLPAKDAAGRLAVANRIATYVNDFTLQDDRPGGRRTWTGQQLLDSGAVTFPATNRVSFNAPDVVVEFGLGRVVGLNDIKVRRAADVAVHSLDQKVVAPLYAVVGCDYGTQVLKDQPNGQSPSTLPPLDESAPSDGNNQISMTSVTPSNVSQNQVPLPTLGLVGDFKANGSNHIDTVGFFRDDTGPTAPFMVTQTPTAVTDTTANVQVPAQVLLDSGTWFIRVGEGGKWSDATTSAVLLVGAAATPTCPAASSGGNFGELEFGDAGYPAKKDDIAHIFKVGPDHDVIAYPPPVDNQLCTNTDPGLIYDGVVDDATCVSTSTGFDPNGPTQGLLSDTDARLRKDTTPACGASRTMVDAWSVNNDYLSCFFTDSTTTIATIANGSYSGPTVLSPDIVKSPRFFFVPVFNIEPSTGKKAYKIVGFRPAFLTDQPTTATKTTGPNPGNGISVGSNHKVAALNFILFDEDALPKTLDAGPPASPVYAFGPKIVTMVN